MHTYLCAHTHKSGCRGKSQTLTKLFLAFETLCPNLKLEVILLYLPWGATVRTKCLTYTKCPLQSSFSQDHLISLISFLDWLCHWLFNRKSYGRQKSRGVPKDALNSYLFLGCVALSNGHNLFLMSFPHLENWDNRGPAHWSLLSIKWDHVFRHWVGWHHPFKGHELGQTLAVGDGQGSLACSIPCGHKELDATWWLNNNNTQALGTEPGYPKCSINASSYYYYYYYPCLYYYGWARSGEQLKPLTEMCCEPPSCWEKPSFAFHFLHNPVGSGSYLPCGQVILWSTYSACQWCLISCFWLEEHQEESTVCV